MKKNLNETIIAESIERVEENLPAGVLARIVYPFMHFGVKNENKRKYFKEVAEKVMADPNVKQKLENRTLFGCQEHPSESQIKLDKDNISHIISELRINEEREVFEAVIDLLPTEAGKFINVLFEAGSKVPVSSRADGELEESIDESGDKFYKVMPEHYIFQTIDFTGDPSNTEALPENIQKNVVDLVKQHYEAKEIDENVAIALLESVNSSESKKLCESIKGAQFPTEDEKHLKEMGNKSATHNKKQLAKEKSQNESTGTYGEHTNTVEIDWEGILYDVDVLVKTYSEEDTNYHKIDDVSVIKITSAAKKNGDNVKITPELTQNLEDYIKTDFSLVENKSKVVKNMPNQDLTKTKANAPQTPNTRGKVNEGKWYCPKCKTSYKHKDLAKGGTCPNCDVPVKCIKEAYTKPEPKFIDYKGFKIKVVKNGPSFLVRLLNKETDKFRQGATVDYAKTEEEGIKKGKAFADEIMVKKASAEQTIQSMIKSGDKTPKDIEAVLKGDSSEPNETTYNMYKLFVYDPASKSLKLRENKEDDDEMGLEEGKKKGPHGKGDYKFPEEQEGEEAKEKLEMANETKTEADGLNNLAKEIYGKEYYTKDLSREQRADVRKKYAKIKEAMIPIATEGLTDTKVEDFEKKTKDGVDIQVAQNINVSENVFQDLESDVRFEIKAGLSDKDIMAKMREKYKDQVNSLTWDILPMAIVATRREEQPEDVVENKLNEFYGNPKTDEERAQDHFGILPADWEKLSGEEKQKYISDLPPRGTGWELDKLEESTSTKELLILFINQGKSWEDIIEMVPAFNNKIAKMSHDWLVREKTSTEQAQLPENKAVIPVSSLMEKIQIRKVKINESILVAEKQKAVELGNLAENKLKETKANYIKDVVELYKLINERNECTTKLLEQIESLRKENAILTESINIKDETLGGLSESKVELSTIVKSTKAELNKNKTLLETKINEIKSLNKSHTEEISKLKKAHTFELVEKYKNTVLRTRGLKLPKSLQTLFEGCTTEAEVDELIDKAVGSIREGKLHSNKLSDIEIGIEVSETKKLLGTKIAKAFEGMGVRNAKK